MQLSIPASLAAAAALPIRCRSPTIAARGNQFVAGSILNYLRRGGFMVAVQSRIFQAGLMLAMALFAALLPGTAHAYTAEQQQACTPDAFRLCGDAVPDVGRVTACMIRNRSQLSPGCAVYFRSPEPKAMPVTTARKPVRITPAAPRKPISRKPVKPKTTKKIIRPR
jgi:hypothetical protein